MDAADPALALAPLAPPGFEDPAIEADYQAARARFLNPPALQQKGLWMIGSLVLFAVLALVQGGAVVNLVILLGVLFFHELGHYLGMVALGYRDVTMFFIPLVGAATSGRRGTASQTRASVVLLLGPTPGILLGVWIGFAALLLHSQMLKTVASYLVVVNALNLLPVMPFDGGRLASALLFSRWAWSERLFTTTTALALTAYGFLDAEPVLGCVGLFVLLTLPVRNRVLRVAAGFRAQEPPLANDPASLDDATTRALFLALREALPANARQPKGLADFMTQALEAASARAPSVGMTLALGCWWGAGLVLSIVGLVLVAAVR